jgi:hypothetical protein
MKTAPAAFRPFLKDFVKSAFFTHFIESAAKMADLRLMFFEAAIHMNRKMLLQKVRSHPLSSIL